METERIIRYDKNNTIEKGATILSNSIVLQTSSTVIEEMKNQYKQAISPTVPQGGIFIAKVPSCTITAYKSGKVMFQGGRAMEEATTLEKSCPITSISCKKNSTRTSIRSARFNWNNVDYWF